jgi:hypothetical protein
MFNDISRAICAGANYLAALGLAVYSESLMRFEIKGDKLSQKRFDRFLELLPKEYQLIDSKLKSLGNRDGLYNRVRCGLAHEYFVKKNAAIITKAEANMPCGIMYNESEDKLTIVVETYFNDFKEAAKKLHMRLKTMPFIDSTIKQSGSTVLTTSEGLLIDPEYEYSYNNEGELVKKKKS